MAPVRGSGSKPPMSKNRQEAAVSTTVSDERMSRTLTAFLRQEVQAPAVAVTEFLDIIIEDARKLQ